MVWWVARSTASKRRRNSLTVSSIRPCGAWWRPVRRWSRPAARPARASSRRTASRAWSSWSRCGVCALGVPRAGDRRGVAVVAQRVQLGRGQGAYPLEQPVGVAGVNVQLALSAHVQHAGGARQLLQQQRVPAGVSAHRTHDFGAPPRPDSPRRCRGGGRWRGRLPSRRRGWCARARTTACAPAGPRRPRAARLPTAAGRSDGRNGRLVVHHPAGLNRTRTDSLRANSFLGRTVRRPRLAGSDVHRRCVQARHRLDRRCLRD